MTSKIFPSLKIAALVEVGNLIEVVSARAQTFLAAREVVANNQKAASQFNQELDPKLKKAQSKASSQLAIAIKATESFTQRHLFVIGEDIAIPHVFLSATEEARDDDVTGGGKADRMLKEKLSTFRTELEAAIGAI